MIDFGLYEGVTYLDMLGAGGAYSPFFAPELVSSGSGYAALSNMGIYYQGGEAN
jgi:hypothetical protein